MNSSIDITFSFCTYLTKIVPTSLDSLERVHDKMGTRHRPFSDHTLIQSILQPGEFYLPQLGMLFISRTIHLHINGLYHRTRIYRNKEYACDIAHLISFSPELLQLCTSSFPLHILIPILRDYINTVFNSLNKLFTCTTPTCVMVTLPYEFTYSFDKLTRTYAIISTLINNKGYLHVLYNEDDIDNYCTIHKLSEYIPSYISLYNITSQTNPFHINNTMRYNGSSASNIDRGLLFDSTIPLAVPMKISSGYKLTIYIDITSLMYWTTHCVRDKGYDYGYGYGQRPLSDNTNNIIITHVSPSYTFNQAIDSYVPNIHSHNSVINGYTYSIKYRDDIPLYDSISTTSAGHPTTDNTSSRNDDADIISARRTFYNNCDSVLKFIDRYVEEVYILDGLEWISVTLQHLKDNIKTIYVRPDVHDITS